MGKTLRFSEIKTTEFNEDKLTITKNNGKQVVVDLNNIVESDTQEFYKVIVKNTIANIG